MQKALDILQTGVTQLMSSDGWRAALVMKSRFHSYSFQNSCLIHSQRPDATLVAGYRAWLQLKRFVKKGEKGIAILAPLLRKDKDGDDPEQKILVGFKVAYVFDLAQTDGEPIPEPPRPVLLNADSTLIQHALTQMEAYALSSGFTVRHDLQEGSALGSYRPASKQIALRADLPPLQRLKTLIHELAHGFLHDHASDRMAAELEAESCAFLVTHRLGLDTSSYSFAYLAGWADSTEALMASGEAAAKTAERILKEVKLTCLENA